MCVSLCIHTCIHIPGPKREQWTTGKGFQYNLKRYQIIVSAITEITISNYWKYNLGMYRMYNQK